MTDNIHNIYTALAKAQGNFAPAKKSSTNPHFKSKYADLQACIEAVGPALNKEGIAYWWRSERTEHGWVVTAVLTHGISGTEISCEWPVVVSKNDAQGFASGSTYARRYSLMAVCGLAPEDDDGNAASNGPTRAQQVAAMKAKSAQQPQRGDTDFGIDPHDLPGAPYA